jgi:P pilus assembly chaperone PapD
MIKDYGKAVKRLSLALALSSALLPGTASADIVLSQVIVDFQAGEQDYRDIEIWNAGTERAFVTVEPDQILEPGLPNERRVHEPDPEKAGLLVSPQRLVLEPEQRRIIRIAAIAPRDHVERIYRVAVKPVAGDLGERPTGLKVLLGYDMLVLVRADAKSGEIMATRNGQTLVFENQSNTAQEIFDGKQCEPSAKLCVDLPSTRLYPHARWSVALPKSGQAEYSISDGRSVIRHSY